MSTLHCSESAPSTAETTATKARLQRSTWLSKRVRRMLGKTREDKAPRQAALILRSEGCSSVVPAADSDPVEPSRSASTSRRLSSRERSLQATTCTADESSDGTELFGAEREASFMSASTPMLSACSSFSFLPAFELEAADESDAVASPRDSERLPRVSHRSSLPHAWSDPGDVASRSRACAQHPRNSRTMPFAPAAPHPEGAALVAASNALEQGSKAAAHADDTLAARWRSILLQGWDEGRWLCVEQQLSALEAEVRKSRQEIASNVASLSTSSATHAPEPSATLAAAMEVKAGSAAATVATSSADSEQRRASVPQPLPCPADALAFHESMMGRLRTFYDAVAEDFGYVKSGSEPLQMFYRQPEGSGVHNFRFIADFPYSAVEVLALAREFDLVASWNWAVKHSEILEERHDFDMACFASVGMPWPYQPRYAAMRALGIDSLDEEGCATVLIADHLIDQDSLPSAASKAAVVNVLDGSGVKIIPVWSEHKGQQCEGCRVILQMNIDLHMRILPAAIINFILKILSPFCYKLAKYVIKTNVRKPGSSIAVKMLERASFYDKMRLRLLTFLHSHRKSRSRAD